MSDIDISYFNWILGIIDAEPWDLFHAVNDYKKLLRYLYEVTFYSVIPNDDNRINDGLSLRKRFLSSYKAYYAENDVQYKTFINKECSILEMMVALAIRGEDNIMYNLEYGDRTNRWFWEMIDNLGLDDMTDYKWNKKKVDTVLYNFLHRNYKPNGEGGLFVVNNPKRDMRNVEIWYQMLWYFNDILEYEITDQLY